MYDASPIQEKMGGENEVNDVHQRQCLHVAQDTDTVQYKYIWSERKSANESDT